MDKLCDDSLCKNCYAKIPKRFGCISSSGESILRYAGKKPIVKPEGYTLEEFTHNGACNISTGYFSGTTGNACVGVHRSVSFHQRFDLKLGIVVLEHYLTPKCEGTIDKKVIISPGICSRDFGLHHVILRK